MARARKQTKLAPPFLKRAWLQERGERTDWPDWVDWDAYPLNFPLLNRAGLDLHFGKPVTIFVGENGSGKSTLLEAIAQACGFDDKGGPVRTQSVEHSDNSGQDGGTLGKLLKTSWLPQVKDGWFFRAETFFSIARYLDDSAREAGAWGPQYLTISHGEGFVAFFEERLNRQGIYIFDEPESALSPSRQFEFLKILRRIQREGRSQVIMATHSPILMALPDADLRQIGPYGIDTVRLEQTDHFRLYSEFIRYPHEAIEAMIE